MVKTQWWHDQKNRESVFQATLDDLAMREAASPQAVMAEVRHQLAKIIVEKIMAKIGPSLDAVLGAMETPK